MGTLTISSCYLWPFICKPNSKNPAGSLSQPFPFDTGPQVLWVAYGMPNTNASYAWEWIPLCGVCWQPRRWLLDAERDAACCQKQKDFHRVRWSTGRIFFFLKNDILLTYDMYVYLEIHNYIIYDISIYDAFWSNLVCFQLHLSKWNVWCHRKLRHQNPSRHGCLPHRPSPRQASDFAGGYGSIEKNGVPMASPWVDEIFSIHCRKNGEIMGHFFLKSEQIWKSSIFFKKKPMDFCDFSTSMRLPLWSLGRTTSRFIAFNAEG